VAHRAGAGQSDCRHYYVPVERSEAYSRLDPSEKSAVSYFLGMAQASVTMTSLLSVTNLVHLDAIMALRGIPSTASRPDFLGLDRHQNEIVAVEAKGRTRGRTADLTRRAKAQSRALPNVVGSSVTCVASIASFDSEGCWTAYLEDPPKNSKVASEYEAIGNLTTADLLVAYYLPIVATMFAAQADRGPSGDTFVVRIPAVDVDVSIPTGIADALGKQPFGEVSRASVADLGSVILRVLQSADERARGRDEVDDRQLFRGSDHVAVRLGRTWRR